MLRNEKLFAFATVAVIVLAVDVSRRIWEPTVANETALKQLEDSDAAVEAWRSHDTMKRWLDNLWLIIPISGVLILGHEWWVSLGEEPEIDEFGEGGPGAREPPLTV